MKSWARTVALLLLSTITAVAAIDVTLVRLALISKKKVPGLILPQTQKDDQKCLGMYSKKSWGGKVDPFILVKFVKNGEDKNKDIPDPSVGVVIWEWKDSMLLGKPADKPLGEVCYTPQRMRPRELTQSTAQIHL
jgi:hypothetical protein